MPVAAAMLAASECIEVVEEITKTVIRSTAALSRHWTARKATAKFAHFAGANFASAASPIARTAPEKIVKKNPPTVYVVKKLKNGRMSPNTTVITATNPAETINAIRDERPYLIHASSPTPYAVVPRYPALEISNPENNPAGIE